MAQYRVGDLVIFSSEVFHLDKVVGQILKIIRDTDKGERNDVYSIALPNIHPVRKYVMRNRNIHGPAPAGVDVAGKDNQPFKVKLDAKMAMDDIADFLEKNVQEDKKKNAEEEILQKLKDRRDAFQKAAEAAILDQQNQVKKPLPKKKVGLWDQIRHEPEVRYWAVDAKDVLKDDQEPAPLGKAIPVPEPHAPAAPPMPVPALPKLEDYKTREGVLPKHFFYKRDGSVIPVYLVSEAKAEFGLSSDHYKPRVEHEHLYIFKTKPGHILHPKYDAYSGEIYYQCQITGNTYYNQHQKPEIYRLNDVLKDDYNQLWIAKASYVNQIKKNPPAPKKKLRQKYKEMPKIKEKDYDANEYVA